MADSYFWQKSQKNTKNGKKPVFSLFRGFWPKTQKWPKNLLTTEKVRPCAESTRADPPFLAFNQPLIRRGGTQKRGVKKPGFFRPFWVPPRNRGNLSFWGWDQKTRFFDPTPEIGEIPPKGPEFARDQIPDRDTQNRKSSIPRWRRKIHHHAAIYRSRCFIYIYSIF